MWLNSGARVAFSILQRQLRNQIWSCAPSIWGWDQCDLPFQVTDALAADHVEEDEDDEYGQQSDDEVREHYADDD